MNDAMWMRYDDEQNGQSNTLKMSKLDQDILEIQKKAIHEKNRKEEALLLEEDESKYVD